MRRLSVSAGLAGLPALVMLGQAAAFWQVIVLTTVVWFCGGIGLALVSILTSLYADGSTRGRSFGQMFLARPLAGVVGGVICGQLTPLIGMLSDRLGRRRLLVESYALAAGGVLLLSTATELWQFWMATALLFAATTANGSVAAALATDLLPRNALRRGMSWLNSMTWVAGIIGFAGTGYLADTLGAAATCLIAALLTIAAAGLLGWRPRLVASTVPLEWRSVFLAPFSHGRKR